MSCMVVTSKALWAVLVALTLTLAGSLVWGFWQRGEAKVLRAENTRLEAGLGAFVADARQRSKTDTKQSTDRAKQSKAVRAVRDELKKEEVHAQEPRPVASPDQLDRLRRLAEAGNAGIRAARELP